MESTTPTTPKNIKLWHEDPMCHLWEWEESTSVPDGPRSAGIVRKWKGGMKNKFRVEPVSYELTDLRCYPAGDKIPTGWRKFRCHCGDCFWSREDILKVEGCPGCLATGVTPDDESMYDPKTGSLRPRLKLEGMTIGNLQVERRVRGKGWLVHCSCGRSRYILGGTALARGAYKTCGGCREEERKGVFIPDKPAAFSVAPPVASPMAPPSALRAPVVAVNSNSAIAAILDPGTSLSQAFDNARIVDQAINSGWLQECSLDHDTILYPTALHPDGCPLCIAAAKLELAL